MTLNEKLEFAAAPQDVRAAFLRPPAKVLLPRNLRLYKWTDRPLPNQPPLTAWWSFLESAVLSGGIRVEGLRVAEERARRLGKSLRDYARVRAAISEQFGNAMTTMLVVRLNIDVWGWVGVASGQPEFAKARVDLQNVFLIGGADQAWVPNLKPGDLETLPPLAGQA